MREHVGWNLRDNLSAAKSATIFEMRSADVKTNGMCGPLMTEPSVFERLTSLLREVFDNDSLVATPDLTASKVEGWNSLGNVRLFLEIERAFSVRFNATEISGLKNVGELAELVEKKTKR